MDDPRFQEPVGNVAKQNLSAALRRSIEHVKFEFQPNVGVIIFAFDFDEPGAVAYIANADRNDCIKLLEAWIAMQRAQSN